MGFLRPWIFVRRVPQAFRFFFRLICVIKSVLFLSGLELLCGLEGLFLLFGLLQRLLVLGNGKFPPPPPPPGEYLTLFSPREMGSLVVCLSLSPPSAIYVHPVG